MVIGGVTGGLRQGGRYPFVSYSRTLGAPTRQAYRAASAGAPGDQIPFARDDGCNAQGSLDER